MFKVLLILTIAYLNMSSFSLGETYQIEILVIHWTKRVGTIVIWKVTKAVGVINYNISYWLL